MRKMLHGIFLFLLACFTLLVAPAWAAEGPPVDGVVVSIHTEQGKKGEELRAYQLKNGKPAGMTTLYPSEERITSAAISPFGNQVALILPGGTVAVVGMDGKNLTELADDALWVQWPASDGGRWVYYMDARDKTTLRRVNVQTKESQAVVTFDHTVDSAAMSQDASPTTGWIVMPGGDSSSYVALYPMARGTGSTFATPEWWQYSNNPHQRLCISPDNTVFGMLGPDGTFLVVGVPAMDDPRAGYRLDPFNYRNRPASWYKEVDWTFNKFATDPHQLKQAVRVEERVGMKQSLFTQPVWAVNHPGWVLFDKLNYTGTPDLGKPPVSSDLLLWDVAAGAHHGIPGNADVTANPAGSFERPVGFWQWLPAEFSLGLYRGKAPYAVSFEDERITEEMLWDFGDGSPRVKGKSVTHTYTKAGHFQVFAEKGTWAKPLREHLTNPAEGLYLADVTVAAPITPTATAYYVDPTHLLVEFSEPVQAKDVQASLDVKIKVEKWTLLDGGRRMALQFAQPITRNDRVHLSGVTDQGQQPLALKNGILPFNIPAWPTNRGELVFLWEDANQCNAIYNRNDAQIRRTELMHDSSDSGLDALGRLQLTQGGMRTNLRLDGHVGVGDLADVTMNSTFSFECTFQPDNLTQQTLRQPPRIVALSSHRPNVSLFMIGQQGNKLLVSIKTDDNWIEDMGQPQTGNPHPKPEERKGYAPYFYGHGPWIEVAQLADTRPHHIMVTYKPGVMVTYLDGEKIYETDRVTGLLNWGFGMLVFGGHHGLSGSSEFWQGGIEGAAMYSRFLEAGEVKSNYQAYSKKIQARDAQVGGGKGK